MKLFILILFVSFSFSAISRPYLFPGYLHNGASPKWSVSAYKWSVSINKRTSNRFFEPTLHISCYTKQTQYTTPGLDIWISFKSHPKDLKPSYAYSPMGFLKMIFSKNFINKPVEITSNEVSVHSSLVRYAYSIFENENYHVALDRSPSTRRWLVQFLNSKELKLLGNEIDIKAVFYHKDLNKWLKETLDKCPKK